MTSFPQDKNTVLVTGVFDVLHIEHLRFLAAAKAIGDYLGVGVETDDRVKQMKGHLRPVNSQEVRLEQLNHIKYVDHAFLLPSQFEQQSDWVQFMKNTKPKVYAVSANTSWLENKKRICQNLGINFKVVHQFNPSYSTTKFLQKLKHEL